MQKYLEDRGEVTFEKIFSQKLGKYSGGSAGPKDFPPLVQLPGPGVWGQEDPKTTSYPRPSLLFPSPRRFGLPGA